MSSSILRDTIVVGILALGVAFAAANREQIYDALGLTPLVHGQSSEDTNASQPGASEQTQSLSGLAVSIPKSKTDGQFWTDARVNSGIVRFLVDTGASSVALTPEDARRAGIRLNTLEYNVPISTAGGENVAAYVNIKSISIGNVTIRNVKALVVPEGLSTSLLGMTFLGQLQKVEATPHALILRL
jgi:aspartyl protease family protein